MAFSIASVVVTSARASVSEILQLRKVLAVARTQPWRPPILSNEHLLVWAIDRMPSQNDYELRAMHLMVVSRLGTGLACVGRPIDLD